MEVPSPRELAKLLKPGMPASPALAWHPALTGAEQYGGAMEPAQKPDVAGLVQALGSARDAMGGPIADRMAQHGAQQQARMASGNFSPTPVTADSMDLADSVAGGLVGNIGLAAAIKAYHGSPHRFDRFDMSKIGTGEGAQAYGHGLYFAENADTAKAYQENIRHFSRTEFDGNRVAPDSVEGDIALQAARVDPDNPNFADAIRSIRLKYSKALHDRGTPPELKGRLANALERLQSGEISADKFRLPERDSGALYTTRLDVEPEDLLDWDAPLSEQSEKVRAALGKLREDYDVPEETLQNLSDGYGMAPLTGEALVDWASRRFGGRDEASRIFQEYGIPGIRYLDQGSRASGEGTRNFVIFDDKLIDIEGVE